MAFLWFVKAKLKLKKVMVPASLLHNNLYGHSMMQLLPTEILDWVYPKDFNPGNYSNNSPVGCFLEVDLDYPDELHDLQFAICMICNAYPLAGETIEVTEKMLPHYQLKTVEDNNFSLDENKKLIPNLVNKRKHKLHYQN